ncbi:MAG: OmpA family protein [Pseudomonadota bacterium]|nr:OmpA family protein [Pseudomonadota bacterium]
MTAFAVLMAAPVTARAQDDVKLYNKGDTPSAEELGQTLFPPAGTRQLVGAGAFGDTEAEKQTSAIAYPIHFKVNSYEIPSEAVNFINSIGTMLQMDDYRTTRLIVEGHTDASGSAAYNKRLSEKRAKAVYDYLVDHFDIKQTRLEVIGKGEEDLFDVVHPFSGENRRVQFRRAPPSEEDLFEDLFDE